MKKILKAIAKAILNFAGSETGREFLLETAEEWAKKTPNKVDDAIVEAFEKLIKSWKNG